MVGVRLHQAWDIALLRARLLDDEPCRFTRHIAFDSTPLAASTRIHVAGYARMRVNQLRDGALDDDSAVFDLPLTLRGGEVTEVEPHNPRNGPIAQISCAIDSGMSGGPVFDVREHKPYVRAIARSDLSVDATNMAGGSGERARTTLLWPVLAFPIPPVGPVEDVAASATEPRISKMITNGAIVDYGDGPFHVVIVDGNPEWRP